MTNKKYLCLCPGLCPCPCPCLCLCLLMPVSILKKRPKIKIIILCKVITKAASRETKTLSLKSSDSMPKT
jgi:hypothetical protein